MDIYSRRFSAVGPVQRVKIHFTQTRSNYHQYTGSANSDTYEQTRWQASIGNGIQAPEHELRHGQQTFKDEQILILLTDDNDIRRRPLAHSHSWRQLRGFRSSSAAGSDNFSHRPG
jgi:hypothetical protein